MKTVALIPAKDEARTIAQVILECRDYVDKIVVCDDGSTDATWKIAEGLGVTLLRNETNEGKGSAMKKLFQKAIEMDVDIAITIDADLQHDPNDIPKLVEALSGADMVIGGRLNVPMMREVGNLILKGFEKMDSQSGFRAYRGATLGVLMPSETGIAVDSEIFRKAKELGLRITEVKIRANYDVPNPSKINKWVHGPEIWFNAVKFKFLKHPILLFILPGLIFLSFGIYFSLRGLQYILTEGNGSLILIILAFALLQTGVLTWFMQTVIRRAKA